MILDAYLAPARGDYLGWDIKMTPQIPTRVERACCPFCGRLVCACAAAAAQLARTMSAARQVPLLQVNCTFPPQPATTAWRKCSRRLSRGELRQSRWEPRLRSEPISGIRESAVDVRLAHRNCVHLVTLLPP